MFPNQSPRSQIQEAYPAIGQAYAAQRAAERAAEVERAAAEAEAERTAEVERAAARLYIAAQKGHVEVVELRLGFVGIDANKATTDGATPFCIAAQNGHVKAVQLAIIARCQNGGL